MRFAIPDEKYSGAIGGNRVAMSRSKKRKEFWKHVGASLVAGGFLIAPMWLMVLHNTLYTALVGTSVLVLLCGLVSAKMLDGLNDVVTVTAGYAAILVVFVGANT
jgi:hypothetical protein